MKYHILSWNVLYRKHEEHYNPQSEILKIYPEEENRLDAIVTFIITNVINSNSITSSLDISSAPSTIICLQEVSLTLLKKLRTAFDPVNYTIFAYNLEREEYLVIIAPIDFQLLYSGKYMSAKACQIITNDKIRVVNCHLTPQRFCRIHPVEVLYALNKDRSIPLAVVGDFNEEYRLLRRQLGNNSEFILPYFHKTYKNKSIDQIILSHPDHFLEIKNPQHFPKGYLSDHNMIGLEFTLCASHVKHLPEHKTPKEIIQEKIISDTTESLNNDQVQSDSELPLLFRHKTVATGDTPV